MWLGLLFELLRGARRLYAGGPSDYAPLVTVAGPTALSESGTHRQLTMSAPMSARGG